MLAPVAGLGVEPRAGETGPPGPAAQDPRNGVLVMLSASLSRSPAASPHCRRRRWSPPPSPGRVTGGAANPWVPERCPRQPGPSLGGTPAAYRSPSGDLRWPTTMELSTSGLPVSGGVRPGRWCWWCFPGRLPRCSYPSGCFSVLSWGVVGSFVKLHPLPLYHMMTPWSTKGLLRGIPAGCRPWVRVDARLGARLGPVLDCAGRTCAVGAIPVRPGAESAHS